MCKVINYSKPVRSNLDDGNRRENIEIILNTKPKKYNAEEKIKKALKDLRRQGLNI